MVVDCGVKAYNSVKSAASGWEIALRQRAHSDGVVARRSTLDEQALGGASDAGNAFDLLQEQILIEVNFWRFKKKIPAVTNALAEEETNIKPEDVLRRMH